MKGKLYGIGTGPGDPELLTLKAVRIMQSCDIIAVPGVRGNERTAFAIVETYVQGKTRIECAFSMEKDEQKRKEARLKVGNQICTLLEQGKTVGFITLGDPTIYSTYMYMHAFVKERGFDTEIIPGIPSFTAAAAAANISLCEGNEPLHIIPAGTDENIEMIRRLNGNKVVMKTGGNMDKVLALLKEEGRGAKIVERCTMEGERIFHSREEYEREEQHPYFSVMIVKEN